MNTKKIQSTWKRSLFGDFDGDGVMNAFDCKPKNKRKQDSDSDEQKRKDQEHNNMEVKEAAKWMAEEIKKMRADGRLK